MEKTYLQWNAVNWITVVLMASFGALFVGLVLTGLNAYGLTNRSASDE
jgi:hypothetical protein